MAGGINISFVSDVRSFIKGTDDIERAMDDVGDSLDDVSKDAAKAGDKIERSLDDVGGSLDDVARDAKTAGGKIERSLSDAGKDAEQSSDKMEKSFRKDFDKVADHAKAAGDKIEQTTKASMSKAGGATGEFKQEAMANVAETASSFDGSMDDIASMVQGTMGGLAALPGVGLGVAAVGALGGLMYSAWKGHAEDVEARVQTMFDNMLESGLDYISEDQIQVALKELYDDDGKMAAVKAAADDLGLSVETVAAAYVTAGTARDTVQATALAGIAEEEAAIAAMGSTTAETSRTDVIAHGRAIERHQANIDGYNETLGLMKDQSDAEGIALTDVESFRVAQASAMASHRAEYTKSTEGLDAYGTAITTNAETWANIPVNIRPVLDTTEADRQMATWLGKNRPLFVDPTVRRGMSNP